MTLGISIQGIPEAISFLAKKGKQISDGMAKGVTEASKHTLSEVKESIAGRRNEPTSVDTGRFLNSVSINQKGKAEAEVYTPIAYAPYLEWGTSRITARGHFTNTLAREKPKIREIIRKHAIGAIV